MTLVFLDTETTGLDPRIHEVWEASWAEEGEEQIITVYLDHDLRTADPKALELNGYWDRWQEVRDAPGMWRHDVLLRQALTGATIVGANPGFDTDFLFRRWGIEVWHHRKIDISSMAVMAFGKRAFNEDGRPPGLYRVRELILESSGGDIPEPDHSSQADVACLKACYERLMDAHA